MLKAHKPGPFATLHKFPWAGFRDATRSYTSLANEALRECFGLRFQRILKKRNL